MPRLTDPSATERPIPRFIGGSASAQPVSGLSAEGGAVMQLGDEMQRAIQIEQEKVDTTKVEDAWNQYKNAALEATMGEKGVLRRQGADAVNGNILSELTTGLQDRRKKIAEGLGTDEQRQRFLTRADATDLQVKHQTLSHIAEQTNAYATTVFQGSESAARAQVAAMPTDPGVFAGARDTLFAQTEALLRGKGVTDKDEIQRAKDKLNDGLWETRIHALLYSQPMLAEAMLRANEKEIKDPKVKLLLQAQTREAALGVSANLEAKKVVDEVRQATPPASGAGTFQNVVGSLLRREGGFVATDGASGAPANFGINQRANPDIDVKSLTREKAVEIYKKRYWDAIQGDRLPPATALVALDAAALQGTEVARKLLEETNGDPIAMIARRREQLKAIAAKNPKQAENLPGWLARMDGLEAEVKQMGQGGMVKMGGQDPVAQNTSGLPSSRDIAAQLPRMLLKVEERANTLYGTDQGNPDRAAFIRRMSNEIQSAVASDVQQLNAIQRQAQGMLIDAVAGLGGQAAGGIMPTGGAAAAPTKGITSFAQIQADPKLFQAWQMMDPQAKVSIERLMEHNLRANDKGDDAMYRELWNRIHLEPGDPRKIDFYAQIVKPEIADRLSIQQIGQLRLEIDRSETPGGRSIAQMRRSAEAQVGTFFKTHIMFTAQPDRQIAATMRWAEDVGKKVDEYVKQNQQEKVRSMFMLDTPESVVSPKYLQTYIDSTPAAGLAAAARAGQAPAVPPAAQPKEIDTREKLDAWFKTLPAEVTAFTGTDGKVRVIPGRPAAPAADGTAPAATAPAPAAMLETGKLAPAAAAAPAPAQEPTVADFEIYKPMSVAEGRAKAGEKRKAGVERERQLQAIEGRLGLLEGLGQVAMGLGKAAFYPFVQGYRSFVQTGEAIAQAIPPERDAVLSAWGDIKRTRVVTAYDAALIERALEYGLPPADEKLARGILKKLEGAR